MAEIVAVTAAAVQFLDVGARLLLSISKLCGKLGDAPQLVQTLRDEITQLVEIVKDLKIERTTTSSAVDTVKASLNDCFTLCRELEVTLDKVLVEDGDSIARKAWKALLTVKREERMREICARLERKKTALSLWIAGGSHARLMDLGQTVEGIDRCLPMILRQISAINPPLEQELRQIVPRVVSDLQPHFQDANRQFDQLIAVERSNSQLLARLVGES